MDVENLPAEPRPDIIISAASFQPDPDGYISEYYGLRPDTMLSIHIDRTLWNEFMAHRTLKGR
jgi:hypothetical protein